MLLLRLGHPKTPVLSMNPLSTVMEISHFHETIDKLNDKIPSSFPNHPLASVSPAPAPSSERRPRPARETSGGRSQRTHMRAHTTAYIRCSRRDGCFKLPAQRVRVQMMRCVRFRIVMRARGRACVTLEPDERGNYKLAVANERNARSSRECVVYMAAPTKIERAR